MSEIHWETSEDSAVFSLGERTLGRYVWSAQYRQPFFHPLWTPHSPQPITVFAPSDHPWHRGLWWSWKYINGLNFWDPHETNSEKTQFGESIVVHHLIEGDEERALIAQQLELREVGTNHVVAHETRKITLHPTLPAVGEQNDFSAWAIDFDLSWQCEAELRFSTTAWPEKSWGGYGGLNFRPARALGRDESILNSKAATAKDHFHGQNARWAAYLGSCDGDAEARPWKSRRYGAAIFDHPANERHPQAFYTHLLGESSEFFNVLKVAPLMRESLVLPAGQMLRFRYRVALFDDWNESSQWQNVLDAAWDAWSTT